MDNLQPTANPKKRVSRFVLALAFVLVILGGTLFGVHPLWRFIRESLMQRVTSAHYEILWPAGTATQRPMAEFASRREALFTTLDRKLDDAASNSQIRIIFDKTFDPANGSAAVGFAPAPPPPLSVARRYIVDHATVRTGLDGKLPDLDPAADAEALLSIAWGKPGSVLMRNWTARWLVGEWDGQELGMAAAEVEKKNGHQKVSVILANATDSPDATLLGAAWLAAVAELAGPTQVRKLYNARLQHRDVFGVGQAVGLPPAELEREWQMWMYAYIAGMPAGHESMKMMH